MKMKSMSRGTGFLADVTGQTTLFQNKEFRRNVDKSVARLRMKRFRTLVPYARNARTHSKRQIRQIADSIHTFGFTSIPFSSIARA
jgi:hypothetical protein